MEFHGRRGLHRGAGFHTLVRTVGCGGDGAYPRVLALVVGMVLEEYATQSVLPFGLNVHRGLWKRLVIMQGEI